jgi:hypothetical protein
LLFPTNLLFPTFFMTTRRGATGEMALCDLGLGRGGVEKGVASALGYRQQRSSLSVPDRFALALAKAHQWLLLTGDGKLRELAGGENVECHGAVAAGHSGRGRNTGHPVSS